MGRNYRSAQGKVVDMSALAAKNERTRAVGNMKVNARGDTIDSTGKIITPVTQKVGEAYQKTVGNRSAQTKRPVKQSAPKMTNEEFELSREWDEEDREITEVKSKESKKK
jgi:hypothetical protein